jgi:hypothetical protein
MASTKWPNVSGTKTYYFMRSAIKASCTKVNEKSQRCAMVQHGASHEPCQNGSHGNRLEVTHVRVGTMTIDFEGQGLPFRDFSRRGLNIIGEKSDQ